MKKVPNQFLQKAGLFVLLLLMSARPMTAQVEMSISGGLTLKSGDADASAYYKTLDVNDKVCALLKVHPSNPINGVLTLDTGAGMATVKVDERQNGDWWFWLSPDTRNISFSAKGYKRTEPVGVSLEAGKVYELKLTVGAALKVIQEYQQDRFVMKLSIQPEFCIVSYGKDASYNMDRVVVEDGYFEAVLGRGIYYYKIENEYYETYTGTYRPDDSSKEVSISLKPAFGYLSVTSVPSGAEAYLDGSMKSVGTTPFKSDRLTKGSHSVLLRAKDYYSSENRYEVRPDGKVQEVPIVRLKPQFGTVTCLCGDAQAELTVSDASGKVIGQGKSGMTLRLNSRGNYKLESAKSGHASQSVGIQGGAALEGQVIQVSVGAPVPLYGGLQISSEPRRAEVYIDGAPVGKTTYMDKALVGEHQVELRLEGYSSARFAVTIEQGKETVVSRKLEKVVLGVFGAGMSASAGVSTSLTSGSSTASPTANCYIVSAPGTYSFPTVKGNSKQSVGYVAKAEVLWESFGTILTPSKGDVIKSVSFKSGSKGEAGTITFSTPATLRNGNAVIAAKNTSGTILWSWHIWVCAGYNPVATGQTYFNNAGVMMDRNLGATSAMPGNVGALGLLYQWGRKDPFLGSSSISSDNKAASTLYWPSPVSSNSIAYAVAHPTTFIKKSDYNDWCYTGSYKTDNTRWQSRKTIYDPCPPGWRVPDGGSNGVWAKSVGEGRRSSHTYDSRNNGTNFSGKFGSASTIWYPAAGWLYDGDGSLLAVGSGRWWSCTPSDNGAYSLGLDIGGGFYPLSDGDRARGFSVRCVQE